MAQFLERLAQRSRKAEGFDRPAICLYPRTWPVGGQFQGREAASQTFFPPGQFLIEELESFLLPDGEIGVLDGWFGQVHGLARAQPLINRGQFAEENRERPAVENDMVRGQDEQMVGAGEPQQFDAQQRQSRQIKRALRLAGRPPERLRLSIGKRERAQVAHRQSQRHRRRDRLNRPAILKSEAGSQYFVSANDVIDGLLEQPCLKRALHPDGDGDVVKGGVRLQLFEEPKPLLS